MAEFTEVMRQARRMCEAFRDGHCSECPIGNATVLECGITVTSEMDCEEVERRVMQWAQEHPEPVYPTWEEGWKQLFPNGIDTPCPLEYGKKYGRDCINLSCRSCKQRPIPAEVAEKLGIKPITEPLPIMQGDFCASSAEEAREKPGLVPEHDGCEGCRYFDLEEDDEPCAHCKGTAGVLEVYRARRDCYELKEG